MGNSLVSSLSLIDTSGVVIITIIVGMLCAGLGLTLYIRARYANIAAELARNDGGPGNFDSRFLARVVREALTAQRNAGSVNTQALVEQLVQSELRGLLIGERFVRASTGLVIILGLVGTFYGLSSSIGRLTSLLAGKTPVGADVTASLTEGLTQTLSGMSVAFSASLFGIVSAILMTLLGVFLNIGDRRAEVMVMVENYLDNVVFVLVRGNAEQAGPQSARGSSVQGGGQGVSPQLTALLAGFGESVSRLEGAVVHFESALGQFASSSRDFREFNHHLKDNIQRMSLSFGDLSDSLRQQAVAINGVVRPKDRS
jgi:methyl-accepting chemotaxis protein